MPRPPSQWLLPDLSSHLWRKLRSLNRKGSGRRVSSVAGPPYPLSAGSPAPTPLDVRAGRTGSIAVLLAPSARPCRREPPAAPTGPSLFPRRWLEVRAPAGGGAGPAKHHVAAAPGAHPAPVGQQRALLRRQRHGGRGQGGRRPGPRSDAPASRR